MPELTRPNPPDVELTLKKAKEELGLSFGYIDTKLPKELSSVNIVGTGYYITWYEFEDSENEKVSTRYVLFPFDKVLIIHRARRYVAGKEVKESKDLKIVPAFGKYAP